MSVGFVLDVAVTIVGFAEGGGSEILIDSIVAPGRLPEPFAASVTFAEFVPDCRWNPKSADPNCTF